jgi:hypothetical protein
MLLGTAAFRAALPGVSSRHIWFPLLAGIGAGGAAASTLLTAPVLAVLLLWFVFFNRGGSRILKVSAYLIGCALPFAPVFWLYLHGPKQTLFNVFQYQALYRRTNWGDANMHDLDALTDWLNSPQALTLLVLFAAAFIFIFRKQNTVSDRQTIDWAIARREFLLAAALGVALVVFISTAHPTFERYFCVCTPFLAIVAALGLYAAGSRLATPRHAWLTCGLVIALGCGIFLRSLLDQLDDEHWSNYEDIARRVTEVTPASANLYADELIFFLLQRDPPEGLEFSYAEKLELPHEQEKLFHIISVNALKQELQAGHFATLQTCRDSIMDDLEPAPYFRHHTEPDDCDLFWEPKGNRSTGKR